MEDIKLIIKDNKIKITVAENLSNSKFLEFLKSKLERIFFYSNERKYITLELYSRDLSNKEVLTLFDIFESFKNFIIDKINCTKKIKEEVVKLEIKLIKTIYKKELIQYLELNNIDAFEYKANIDKLKNSKSKKLNREIIDRYKIENTKECLYIHILQGLLKKYNKSKLKEI